MKVKLCIGSLAFLLLLSLLSGVASAQIAITPGTACATPTRLVADGRLHSFSLGGGASVWFDFEGSAGRSYSFDVYSTDQTGQANSVTVFNTTDVCGGGSTLTTTARTTTFPALSAFDGSVGFRRAFVAPNSGTYRINVDHSIDVATHPTIVSLSETTLYSPRWSTFGNFYTSWGINNTTNSSCSYTLTVVSTAGATVATATASVAAGRTAFRDTRATDLNVAASQSGNVILGHNCPPGGIEADGFMVNETTTPVSVIAVKFEAVRETQH